MGCLPRVEQARVIEVMEVKALRGSGDKVWEALHLAKAMIDPENQPPQFTVREAMDRIDEAICLRELELALKQRGVSHDRAGDSA